MILEKMMKGIIRLGDATTHGGMVIQASSEMVVEGKPAARWAAMGLGTVLGSAINQHPG